ncbi:MAG: hypothetical protein CLLPBCKN_004222 [Chroococcidiopsis cubana SAG 39.79]|nr:hypothetical protein [Chroococcidiopsis cubana SAG 39.79]
MYAADALILGEMADGVILVTRPGVVDTDSAHIVKEALHRSGLNILGLVINGVVQKNEPNSYFYYSNRYSEQNSQTCQKTTM